MSKSDNRLLKAALENKELLSYLPKWKVMLIREVVRDEKGEEDDGKQRKRRVRPDD